MYFAFIIIILLILIWNHVPAVNKPIEPYSSHKDNLKTGDIVVVIGYGFVSGAIRLFDRSPATHVGFIIKENNHTYVCDLDWGTWFGHDVHIEPIQSFIDRHTSVIGIIPVDTAVDSQIAPVDSPVNITLKQMRAVKCKFDMSLTISPMPGRIVCTAFVHRFLKKYGNILPHDKSCESCVTPKTYYMDPNIIMMDTAI